MTCTDSHAHVLTEAKDDVHLEPQGEVGVPEERTMTDREGATAIGIRTLQMALVLQSLSP